MYRNPPRLSSVRMTRSFLGEEDTQLEAKLAAELPGIFQWAVAGWESLRARGRFVQPAASADAIADFEAIGAPHVLFVRDEIRSYPIVQENVVGVDPRAHFQPFL